MIDVDDETQSISIHSLRVEGDEGVMIMTAATWDFNPLPPCGGRLVQQCQCSGGAVISIHSLRVEGDSKIAQLSA